MSNTRNVSELGRLLKKNNIKDEYANTFVKECSHFHDDEIVDVICQLIDACGSPDAEIQSEF